MDHNKDTNKKAGDMAHAMIRQAKQFELSEREAERKSTVLAWRIATGALILAGVAVVTAAIVIFIKRPSHPVVLRVDNASGQIDVLRTLSEEKTEFSEATNNYYLRRYVEARESYDWETIQDMYDTVRLMSAPKERSLYTALYSQPDSPQKVLKDQVRVIAKAGTITYVGKTALVYYSKTLKPLNGGELSEDYWVATISFEYKNIPMTDKERLFNPVGFQVLSYRVDHDASKAASSVAPSGGHQP